MAWTYIREQNLCYWESRFDIGQHDNQSIFRIDQIAKALCAVWYRHATKTPHSFHYQRMGTVVLRQCAYGTGEKGTCFTSKFVVSIFVSAPLQVFSTLLFSFTYGLSVTSKEDFGLLSASLLASLQLLSKNCCAFEPCSSSITFCFRIGL